MKVKLTIISCLLGLVFIQAKLADKEPTNKIELGKKLFFDPLLSKNNKISCASCHRPEYAFADTRRLSLGVGRTRGVRNSPSAMNLNLQNAFFWDGRAKTLEEQALIPIENPVEMNTKVEAVLAKLKRNAVYQSAFKKVFNTEPTRSGLSQALAAYERTLETSDSPFDNWQFNDDQKAVGEDAKRGLALFNGKAKCVNCHFGPDFTTNQFRNIGLFNGKNLNDSGRAAISHNIEDLGKFKVGSLRNVAVTAPYMHNGMFKTLAQVIDHYNEPDKDVPHAINRDSLLSTPLKLSQIEKKDLEAFLVSLTDKQFNKVLKAQTSSKLRTPKPIHHK